MDLTLLRSQWPAYVRTNWLKIAVFGILGFIILKKDFSFQINLNAPGKVQEAVEPAQPPLKSTEPTRASSPKKMTEQRATPAIATIPKQDKASMLGNIQPFVEETKPAVAPAPTSKPASEYQFTGELDEWSINEYINRFSHVAISEQRKFKIPASIILANGLFHSFAGQRELAIKSNNHFGLKCGYNWTGASNNQRGTCYRKYNSAWESFRDHSRYLSEGKFAVLQQRYELTDYKSWAKGLEQLGFANQPKLAQEIIELIEQYKLYQFDLDGI